MKADQGTGSAAGELHALVRSRLGELGLSYEAAAARSSGLVSHGTLHRLAVGLHHGRLRERTIRGVALALDVPQSTVRQALPADVARRERPFVLPPRADRLDARERRLVLDYVDRLIAKRRREADA
ncbi:MAG: hypothetical protein ACRDNS_04530, partial [Trebonia sp.]